MEKLRNNLPEHINRKRGVDNKRLSGSTSKVGTSHADDRFQTTHVNTEHSFLIDIQNGQPVLNLSRQHEAVVDHVDQNEGRCVKHSIDLLVFGDAQLVEFVGFDDKNRSESPVSTVNI